ncbi:MAG: purine-nucleoside phosphorylase [Firmicutes bacterium]|nr:purine-nucleoside phosphorylase [Bacillota bacterium]
MSTPHISAQKGDFAKTVLMPGDPLRAKFIADTYLTEAKLVTSVRNILGYTGYYKGKRISVMASGMGQPSIGIYSYELFTHFGVETIIRIGTCGTYRDDINLFDLLIAVGTFSAIADFELAMKAYHRVKEAGLPVHAGNILSSDVFYDIDPNAWKKWATLGIIGVEMESFALYVNAARLQKKALCLLTVTDQIVRGERATSEQRELGLRKMIEVALDIAE